MSVAETTTKSLHLTVITPARAVFDSEAQAVVVPAFDGELGVLPGHAAMLALLGTGELRVTLPDASLKKLAIRGGFLQVNKNKVTVLTPESVAGNEIAQPALAAEMQKLDTEKPVKAEDREALEQRRQWVKARQKIVKK